MFDISHLLVSPAFAQDAAAAAPPSATANLVQYVPFVLIFLVFYVLVIRPQNKKLDEQQRMLKALQRGDRVVLTGGVHGKITRVEGDEILYVEIANGVEVKVLRSGVQGLEAKPQPANDGEKK